MGPRAGLDSAENLAPTGIRSPARREYVLKFFNAYQHNFVEEIAASNVNFRLATQDATYLSW